MAGEEAFLEATTSVDEHVSPLADKGFEFEGVSEGGLVTEDSVFPFGKVGFQPATPFPEGARIVSR
jgi:hypothetical protein